MAKDYSMQPYETPRVLEAEDIAAVVDQFRQAALNAKAAGFDGVEIHAANGYLLDQFLRDGSNQRSDAYGGWVENRARLLVEVIEAAIEAFGAYRVGVRLSPHSGFNSMRDSDPLKTYTEVAAMLNAYELAYVHMVEPLAANAVGDPVTAAIRRIYKGTLIVNEGLTREAGEELLNTGAADLVSFGKPYISNPDLVERFRKGFPLAQPDPATMYGGAAKGYTDYPVYEAG
jgi:N-ethylmaleimide reductase